MFWALIGICISCIYTATVAAFMSEHVSLAQEVPRVYNNIIATFAGSLEAHLVLQKGGVPVCMSTTQKIFHTN